MKQATILMSVNGSVKQTSRTVYGTAKALPGKLADAIRNFAARQGIALSAVDYQIAR